MSTPAPADRDQAIPFITDTIPPETLANVRMLMQNKQTPWHHASHFVLGIQVRNSLRWAGDKWSDAYLDDRWHELVEEAARSGDRGG